MAAKPKLAGIKPLANQKSRESGEMFSHFRQQRSGLPCPKCGATMQRELYAQGYAVYGCGRCDKCFYRRGSGWIELAFSYEDFFGEE